MVAMPQLQAQQAGAPQGQDGAGVGKQDGDLRCKHVMETQRSRTSVSMPVLDVYICLRSSRGLGYPSLTRYEIATHGGMWHAPAGRQLASDGFLSLPMTDAIDTLKSWTMCVASTDNINFC